MAQCKRCGTSFDYAKREGVCPKCCFYNRPPGTAWEDEEWTRHYNIEDNSYELPKMETGQGDDFDSSDSGRFQWKKNKKECHKEGSHSHKTVKRPKQTGKNRSSVLKKVVVLLVLLVVLMIAFIMIARVFVSVKNATSPAETAEFVVENAEWEELQDGVKAGQLTYQTDEKGAVVLFEEGELPELPEGEKCIGVWLGDDESVLDYDGIYWDRPYVYDGKNYHTMVHPEYITSSDRFNALGLEFFPRFTYSYDQEGVAVFFVDKDAETVVLNLPQQTATKNDQIEYTGVTEIEIPIQEKEGAE